MKLRTIIRSPTIFRIAALGAACSLVWAQPPVTNLEIQGENWVAYFHDIFDFSQMASNPNIAIPLRPGKPFQSFTDITDIVAVNGKPAKGVWINRGSAELKLNPNAVAGAAMAIADVNRLAMVNHYLEILQPDGTPIGTITASGMNFGTPPPGPISVGRATQSRSACSNSLEEKMKIRFVLTLLLSGAAWAQAPGTFTPTGRITTPRSLHTATLLVDGRVLIAGGMIESNVLTNSEELYDPSTGTFIPTGSMTMPRASQTATLLPDGKVLIAGAHFVDGEEL